MRKTAVFLSAIVVASWVGAAGAFAADGAALYKAQCSKCHGDDGKADSPTAKAMKAPALAGNAKLAGMSAADIAKSVKENKKHASVTAKMSDDDLAAVAGHVKTLAK
ncbi:MAG: c-type cytochrome [Deltaproteobacteria bacterium]|nr:c-type cytochrome [Deltaproteobacteria bacterium]